MNRSTTTGWYIGFNCHECSRYIPVLAAYCESQERVQAIVANALKVMCPDCGASKHYEPAEAFLFRVDVSMDIVAGRVERTLSAVRVSDGNAAEASGLTDKCGS